MFLPQLQCLLWKPSVPSPSSSTRPSHFADCKGEFFIWSVDVVLCADLMPRFSNRRQLILKRFIERWLALATWYNPVIFSCYFLTDSNGFARSMHAKQIRRHYKKPRKVISRGVLSYFRCDSRKHASRMWLLKSLLCFKMIWFIIHNSGVHAVLVGLILISK